MTRSSNVEPSHYGLVKGAERMRKIRPRTGRLTMPGWFATRKGTWPSLRTETTLEIDGLAQFEANADCVLMATQPHSLIYHEPEPNGATIRRRYTPDVAILMDDGAIAVVDFKPADDARRASWVRKSAILAEAYRRDHGITFTTVTDLAISIEPRRTNVSIMMMHRLAVPDVAADVAVAAAIQSLGLPTTIGAIRRLCDLPSTQAHADRAFTAVIEAALRGDVDLDLGVPLGPLTTVSPRRPKNGRRT